MNNHIRVYTDKLKLHDVMHSTHKYKDKMFVPYVEADVSWE